MGFSINPFEFVKMMSERRKMSREQVIDWLECVRADGRLLSETWTKIAAQLREEAGTKRAKKRKSKLLLELEAARDQQQMICSRMDGFYNLASSAVAGRLETAYWDGFINCLGGVLVARTKARSRTDEFIREEKMLLESGERSIADTIEEAIAAVQKELGALEAFIQTIKTAPKAIR
jgi:hypothetical protein